ncbi:MAG: hypothetical protein IJ080_07750 [Oscillospiraceae bacterium]|nr:hypothetical protein [Oscillospiraceae bacterium]
MINIEDMLAKAYDDRQQDWSDRIEDEGFTEWQKSAIYADTRGYADAPLEKISTKVLKKLKFEFAKAGVKPVYDKFMFNPTRHYTVWVEDSREGLSWGISPVDTPTHTGSALRKHRTSVTA